VYPASFEYFAPTTLDEALTTLDRLGDEGKVLAGGQSLIPVMKLRFFAPTAVVDINRIPGLDGLEANGGLRFGPLVRHTTCERSPQLRGRFGLFGDAARQISDPLVRNLGTVAGSLAHADPQGDWGSVMLASRAELTARSAGGERTIPIDDLLLGPFTTSLRPGELITEIRVPDPGPSAGGAYLKLERKVGDFATVGVAVQVSLDGAAVREIGIALTSVSPINMRAARAEEALRGRVPDDEAIREAARLAAEECDPIGDLRGTAEYKRNVVRVYVERGLRQAFASARGEGGGDGNGNGEDKPKDETDNVGPDYFAGEETIEGVKEELDQKEEQ
jgi:aerobic carbon-monoxide dehydrogenase medium subunit